MNILFSQVREDPNVEQFVVDKLDKVNALIVGSGGCTLMSMLEEKITNIEVIEVNQEQLYLIRLKLAVVCKLKQVDYILDFFEGRLDKETYDKILDDLDLDHMTVIYWKYNMDFIYSGCNISGRFELLFKELVDSGMNYTKVFNKEYLISIFGESAVVNSNQFFDHFENIVDTYKSLYTPENNYFYYQILNNKYFKECLPVYFYNIKCIEDNKSKIEYVLDNYVNYLTKCEDEIYNLIQTSNLTDWMDRSELDSFVNNLYRCSKKGGYVILRRLNGCYSLKDVVSKKFEIVNKVPVEKSHFYSEVVVGYKL
jgi:S-adenosylmethionine:diacylglycerol 3-amino-3-carboxypropyl transferase